NQVGSYGLGGDDYFTSAMPDFGGNSSGYAVGGSSGGAGFDDEDMDDVFAVFAGMTCVDVSGGYHIQVRRELDSRIQNHLAERREVKKRKDERRGKEKVALHDEVSATRQEGLQPGWELDMISARQKVLPPGWRTILLSVVEVTAASYDCYCCWFKLQLLIGVTAIAQD
ncbi:hypothetical protein Tco_1157699, partial [Tanacetum coccineum]